MVSYNGNIDGRPHNTDTPRDITDENIDDRTDKFAYVINIERTYRIPRRSFCDLGKISSLVKIDFKIRCSLETDMKKNCLKPNKNNSDRRVRSGNNFRKSQLRLSSTNNFF